MSTTTATRTIGPRMIELCEILNRMGGRAAAQSHVYMQLDYQGGSSNRFGHAALERAMRAGLIEVVKWDGPGNAVPVRLTGAGLDVVFAPVEG